ncbi:MAG: serine/threonine protein phosphatase PrpC [Myxococcota bacterium]|jgi:serine/threonine protein phosphatase PrpC
MPLKLTWAGLTDVGMKRAGNEDAYIVAEDLGLYVVCDGMGGHASGEVASAMTTEGIVAFARARHNGDDSLPYQAEEGVTPNEVILSNAIQHANDKVYIAGMKDPSLEGMGTTVVAVQEVDGKLILAHVGDSRIYRFRGGVLEQVTRDHSLLNHKIDMGELTDPDDIKNFKHGNIIVRAIGLKDYVRPETGVIDRQAGDVMLLCSDGLTDLVDDWAIENVLEANQDDLEEAAIIFIRMANDRGGKDNITVILMRFDAEPEMGFGDGRRNEATSPGNGGNDDVTDPGLQAYEDDDEDEDGPTLVGANFQGFSSGGDDQTAPHTPVFMWDEQEPAGRRRDRKNQTDQLPSIVVDDELPSIIVDD